ncbi:ThuA domain-containing protein [Flavobacterium algicola]|uniref:ThuA domain-containing protein n=1 Tax=Flavobacterium algicola TaxID=556529 RepID=UPI001EFE98C2|nr:ThuA domain-containing protein [Flavobacterium algicola]MCG9792258.1 ThuA domain-containing protein [Flavobacterium algicola]
MNFKKIKQGQSISILMVLFLLFSVESSFAMKTNKILIFSKTAKFHHQSIPAGIAAIIKLGEANGFVADTTTNSKSFTKENLKQYTAVIFLSTTGDVLNEEQQLAFENYIQSGGGFVGVHAATDCEYDWAWYGNLVGAYFSSHPKQQDAILKVSNKKHIATKHLPAEWKRKDEWYNYKWMAADLKVLITIDENSYDAGKGKMGANHPMAWYHDYDGGRSFYTALGHTDESYQEPLFLQHLLGGIKYAMGKKK